MLIELEILLGVVLVAALLLLSVLDFALSGVNKIALRRITESAARRNRLTEALAESRTEALMAVHISIQTLLIALAVLLTGAFLRYTDQHAVAFPAAAGATLALVLVFRQLVPRVIALRHPDLCVARLVPILGPPYFILRPIVRLIMAALERFSRRDADQTDQEEEASEEEIQAFIDAGQEEGILEQDEGVMVQSIVEFGDKVALEVMTPRTQIVAADVTWSVGKLASLFLSSRHSRMPVYRDELDNIEGVIHVMDLLRVQQSGAPPDNLRPLLHPIHFVPETKPIDDLLEEMKKGGQRVVLVVDEYGGISGLITIQDLVEEIVGEIGGGEDSGEAKVLDEGPGSYLVPGNLELDAIDSRLGVTVFPDTECTTVGGAVVELFGRLPSVGERIRHDGFAIEVVDADRRKIRSLRIRALTSQVGS